MTETLVAMVGVALFASFFAGVVVGSARGREARDRMKDRSLERVPELIATANSIIDLYRPGWWRGETPGPGVAQLETAQRSLLEALSEIENGRLLNAQHSAATQEEAAAKIGLSVFGYTQRLRHYSIEPVTDELPRYR